LALLYFFGDIEGLVVVLGNVAIHEGGHLFMLRRFGVYIREISFDMTGLCIRYNGLYLTRRREFLAAAAGPVSGLGMSVLVSLIGNLLHNDSLLLFAGAGVVLSVFNLLPARPLDGWRMLNAFWPTGAHIIGECTGVMVLLGGLYAMYRGWGTALAFMGIVLLVQEKPIPGNIRKWRKVAVG